MINKRLVLDEGHGYNTAGKRTPDDIREWTMNNKVVSKIIDLLKDYNVDIKVVNDRTGKTDTSLAERCNKTNSYKADLLVSIHHNAFTGDWGTHTGTSVFIHNTMASAFSKQVAEVLAPKLASYTNLRNRGVCKDNFYMLRNSNCPAVLCEGGFMDSTIDKPIITSSNGQLAYAKAVAETVIQCLGLTKNKDVVVNKPTEIPSVSPSNSYTVKINTDVLNVRGGAGMSYKVVTTVKKNEVYTIMETVQNWGQLLSGAGWICLDYCILPNIKPNLNTSYIVKINTDTLNVRGGAGTNYKINTTVKKGEKYTIVAESNGFGKLKSGAGWISLSYCIKQ